MNLAHLGSTPSVGKAPSANPWCLTQEGRRWCLGNFQYHVHLLSQLTVFPSPRTQTVATYRSIEFASAIHGHEESTSNTKYAHHSSFHRGDFQQTYIGDMGNQGDEVLCPEAVCVVSVLCSPRGSHPWCGVDPHAPALLWVATDPQPHAPRAAPYSMLGPLFF